MSPSIQTTASLLDLIWLFLPQLFFAVICGGLIGVERELKHKPAGVKTNILICLGAMLYTSVSLLLVEGAQGTLNNAGDPSRVAAQIVSGIGFLGGGAIIQARGTIVGLTTAATIWVVAAIGICIGIGHWEIALIVSVATVLLLMASNLFEDKVLGRTLNFACSVVVSDQDGQARGRIHEMLNENDLMLSDFEMETRNDGKETILSLSYRGHREDSKKFMLDLWSLAGIREVKLK